MSNNETNQTFLLLSMAPYENGTLPNSKDNYLPGVHLIGYEYIYKDGFGVNVFKNDLTGNTIISFEGSNGNTGDPNKYSSIVASLVYPHLGITTPNIQDALNFTNNYIQKYGDKNVYVTGFSLGALDATEVANKFNLPGVVFASPGIEDNINKKNSNYNNLINYIINADPIANYRKSLHYGQVINIGDINNQNKSFIQRIGLHNFNNYSELLNLKLNHIYYPDYLQTFKNLNQKNILNFMNLSGFSKDPIIIYKSTPAVTNLSVSSTYYAYNGKTEQRTAWVAGGYNNSSFLVKLDNSGNPVLLTDSDLTSMGVNGVIDSNNNNWNNLYLWADNGDGKLESGELTALTNSGISSIQTQLTIQNTDANGSTLVSSGKINMKDGSTEKVGDVNLATDSTYTITQKDQELSAGTLSTIITTTNTDGTTTSINLSSLPNIHDYGVLSSLTANDNSLYR